MMPTIIATPSNRPSSFLSFTALLSLLMVFAVFKICFSAGATLSGIVLFSYSRNYCSSDTFLLTAEKVLNSTSIPRTIHAWCTCENGKEGRNTRTQIITGSDRVAFTQRIHVRDCSFVCNSESGAACRRSSFLQLIHAACPLHFHVSSRLIEFTISWLISIEARELAWRMHDDLLFSSSLSLFFSLLKWL